MEEKKLSMKANQADGQAITRWLDPKETFMASTGFCECGEPFPKHPKSNYDWIREEKQSLMRDHKRGTRIEVSNKSTQKGFERLVHVKRGKKMKGWREK